MLTAGAAAEIVAGYQNVGAAIGWLIEHKISVLGAILFEAHFKEQAFAQTGPLDGLEELFGDDHVGINIDNRHGCRDRGQAGELFHLVTFLSVAFLREARVSKRTGRPQGVPMEATRLIGRCNNKLLDRPSLHWQWRVMSDVTNTTRFSICFTYKGILRGAQRLLPVCVFVIPFGVAFGAAAIEAGLSVDQAMAMSLFVFAGASQFAVLDMWQSPLPYISIALVVLAVNARHLILGAAISPYVNPLPPRHWFGALVMLSDVNFADSYQSMKDGERDAGHLLGGGLLLWTVWAISTAVGVVAGEALGDLQRFGVDVVMAAFFGALTIGMVPSWRKAVPVIVACAVALAALPFVPTGWNIIVAAFAGGFVGALDPAAAAGGDEGVNDGG